jgi:ribosome-binding protein aMBF1 (putative translation factor)
MAVQQRKRARRSDWRKLRASSGEPFVLPKSLRSKGHKALLAVLVASRREAGLTQRQLADRLGVPPSVIGKIEIGERRLDVVEFTAIARALKLEPAVLYERFLAWERAGRPRYGTK